MENLPDDCLLECFSYISYIEVNYFRTINHRFNRLCSKSIVQKYRLEYNYIGIVTDVTPIINHYRIRDWMVKNNMEFAKDINKAKKYFELLPEQTIPTLRKFLLSSKRQALIIYGDGIRTPEDIKKRIRANSGKSTCLRMFKKIMFSCDISKFNDTLLGAYKNNKKIIGYNDSYGHNLSKILNILLQDKIVLNEDTLNEMTIDNLFNFIIVLRDWTAYGNFCEILGLYRNRRDEIFDHIRFLQFDNRMERKSKRFINNLMKDDNNQIFSILGPLLE